MSLQKKGPSQAERLVKACAEIVSELVTAHQEGRSVNLNTLKTKYARENKLTSMPKLVDIIAAIPEQYKKILLPKLKAKPIRTASGIAVVAVMCKPHRCPHIAMTGNICVYCLDGESTVSMIPGFSVRIKDIQPLIGSPVLSYNETSGGLEPDQYYAWAEREGLRPCVELRLLDGRTVVCTEDHEFMTSRGWLAARDIDVGVDWIYCGPTYPVTNLASNSGWSLDVVGLSLSLTSAGEVLRAMAFSRIAGLISSCAADGLHINQDGYIKVGLNSQVDATAFQADVQLLCGAEESIESIAEERGDLLVTVPEPLSRCLATVCSLVAGGDPAPVLNLPEFVVDPSCPVVIVRSFLSGLLSGNGVSAMLTQTSGKDSGTADPALCWECLYLQTTEYDSTSSACSALEHVVSLLGRCGIDRLSVEEQIDSCLRGAPKVLAIKRSTPLADTKVLDNVSFAYSALKQARAEAYTSYARYRAFTTAASHQGSGSSDCPELLSTTEFLDRVEASSLFAEQRADEKLDVGGGAGSAAFPLSLLARGVLPRLALLVTDKRPVGHRKVYDISVKQNQCFVANGMVAHNCPGGPDSDFEYSTQSYTGYEPTSMRAIRARYDPYEQARGRVDQLKSLGHSVDKVEYIIMGGTFMSLSEKYRDWFIANLHDALSGHRSNDVDEAVRMSEQSQTKCIGITIETRPDYCLKPHLSQMLRYGCTRLEIGVQSVYEDVARDTNRGHTVRAVCESFHMAKDAGYKVVAHMMPDLPNVGMERDLEQFKEFFENPAFRADGLKIYPTLVIRGTGLYELWRTGRYKNYTPNGLIDLVARILALVPPWTRVYRVQRDIPMPLVTSGVENGNLRELALQRMRDLGTQCRDVRTREVGIVDIHSKVKPEQIELIRRDYVANGGWETFLSYEDPEQDILVGLLRLRKCSPETFRPELTQCGQCSIVRELHVYGSVVPVHSRDPGKFQHQGFGTLLMEEAERIAREEHGSVKLAVISGVGTRHYYRKLGYELDGPYMSKMLT